MYKKIYWWDAESKSHWQTKEEIKEWVLKRAPCITIGQIIYEDKKVIITAASHDGDESWGELICIPRPLIDKIEEL